jgi:transcriptional regulator with XRE-family HTH domain
MLWCMPVTTPKARRLGAALREARIECGLGVRELANRLGKDHSLVSRYERGHRAPKPEDVATILGILGVNGDRREEILALARGTDDRRWLAVTLPELQQQLAALIDFEREATAIVDIAPLLIPGLLQTSAYSRAIMTRAEVPASEISTRVAVRIGRRDVLDREAPVQFTALIGEPVLRQRVGSPAVMAEQLRHLLRVAEAPNVDLRVIPGDSDWHPGLEGPFSLMDFEEESPIVHLENRRSALFLHEEDDVAAYREAVAMVLREAMSRPDSSVLIAREAEQIERIA